MDLIPIKVFIRVRPLISWEKRVDAQSKWDILNNTLKSSQYSMNFGK